MATHVCESMVELIAQLRKQFPAMTNEEFLEAVYDGVDEYDLLTGVSLDMEECLN